MALAKKTWLHKYGLKLVGNGPAFIASIEKGSIAEGFGLQAGDRIIQIDGFDVNGLSADVIVALIKNKKSYPTSLGIVSGQCKFVLHCGRLQNCDFSVTSDKYITVTEIDNNGMAYLAGLRKGDIIVAVNNKPLTKIKNNNWEIYAEDNHVTLSVIPTGERGEENQTMLQRPQIKDCVKLFNKLNKYFGDDLKKKLELANILKNYSENGDIFQLCIDLDRKLKKPNERKVLKHIWPYIPTEQQDIFEPLMKKKCLYCNCFHQIYSPNKKYISLNIRITCANNPIGFVIKGYGPTHIEWIEPGSPAEESGVLSGDFIMEINHIDTRNMSHEQVSKILQDCGPAPMLQIERHPMMSGKYEMNTLVETTNFIANTSEESFGWIIDHLSHYSDNEGFTFKQKMDKLLTPLERRLLVFYFFQYTNSSDVITLLTYLRLILDTPSKKSLWLFLILKMSRKDRKYIRVKENLDAVLNNTHKNPMDYHLNLCESKKIKNNLDIYATNRTFGSIIDIENILNTPAKQTLWSGLLPKFIPQHQDIVKSRLLLSNKQFATTPDERNNFLKEFPINVDSELSDSSGADNSISSSSVSHEENYNFTADIHQHSKSKSCTECERMFWSYAGNNQEPQTSAPDKFLTSFLQQHFNTKQNSTPVSLQNAITYKNNSASDLTSYPKNKFKPNKNQALSKKYNQERTRLDGHSGSTNDISAQVQAGRKSGKSGSHVNPTPSTSKDHRNEPKNQKQKDKYQSTEHLDTSGLQGLANEKGNQEVIIPQTEYQKVKTSQDTNIPVQEGLTLQNTQASSKNANKYSKNEKKTSSKKLEPNKCHQQINPEFLSKSPGQILDRIKSLSNQEDVETKLRSKFKDEIQTKKLGLRNPEDRKAPKLTATGILHEIAEISNVKNSLREDEKYRSQKWLKSHISVSEKVKQLESNAQIDNTKIVPPVPPPIPNFGLNPSKARIKNKRLHWQKIEGDVNENTIWYKVNKGDDSDDIIPLLNLEKRFAVNNNNEPEKKKLVKKPTVSILNSRKSYNISILIAHYKLPASSIKSAILSIDDQLLTYEFLRQLRTYSPSQQERQEFNDYNGLISNLNKADRLIYELIKIPQYEDRLEVLMFRADFKERISKFQMVIDNLKNASLELRESELLVNCLQLILAMGNFLNEGNARISKASGFRIHFLTEIDNTKDVENKTSLLHALTEAMDQKYPGCNLRSELPSVIESANVSNTEILSELKEIETSWQKSKDLTEKIEENGSEDHIKNIMNTFLDESASTLEDMFKNLEEAEQEFQTTLQFFGEKSAPNRTTNQIFEIFAEFVRKYEKRQREMKTKVNPIQGPLGKFSQ